MIPGRISLIIPSRHERFLNATIVDVLAHAVGDLEIIPILEGYWPDPPLPEDPRIVPLHFGIAQGMRQAINAAARIATGEYLMKLDAHASVQAGFDEILKADCDRDWIVVPRRFPLDADIWGLEARSDNKYPIDYEYLSYPLERLGDPNVGLHGAEWRARREQRRDILIDDNPSFQGSCWFMHRDHWARLGEMDHVSYGPFFQEAQEIGMKTWLSGGRVVVNKKTSYMHLRKGKKWGRGYVMSDFRRDEVTQFTARYWLLDQWKERKHDMRWLIELFHPMPTWPLDLDEAFHRAHEHFRALV